ncbi:hypothetical protein RF11_03392 [Thelohanellus kitauei]|uniref:Uncharacterized protein n=1 Tax=Thelohanellus kitauei TaxID=669202 RepID=A0A0C2MSW2_THEKT|nr:hypothetical protein RF11_03392 [Thelohanellus kitauei]
MEEIKGRIDKIIINGLLITSNDYKADAVDIYYLSRFYKLVTEPLEEFVFEGFGNGILNESDFCALSKCTRILCPADHLCACIDHQKTNTCNSCNSGFPCSERANHTHKHWVSTYIERTCDCGIIYSWMCDDGCSKHACTKMTRKVLTENFVTKLNSIIEYLCEILAEIISNEYSTLDNHIEEMLDTYLRVNGSITTPYIQHDQGSNYKDAAIDTNSRKSCLVLLDYGIFNIDDFTECFMSALDTSRDSTIAGTDIYKHGITFARYLSDVDECEKAKQLIDESWRTLSNDRSVSCRVAKVYHLYFMKIAPHIIGLIKNLCIGNTEIRKVVLENIFHKSPLLRVFFQNEHVLWTEIRESILFLINITSIHPESVRIYVTSMFLNTVNDLYNHLMIHHSYDVCNSRFDCIVHRTSRCGHLLNRKWFFESNYCFFYTYTKKARY